MRITSHDVQLHVRRLYFTERLTFEQIAERLGMSLRTVRRAVVIDGGLRPPRNPGPFHKESDA